jgi:ATP-dependent HslUV protease ATP-binding subunit HslU
MVRDLAELSVNMVKQEAKERVEAKAREQAEERLLDLLLPQPSSTRTGFGGESEPPANLGTRDKMRKMLHEGKLDDREVEIEVTKTSTPFVEVMAPQGMEELEGHLKEMFSSMVPKKTKQQRMKVPDALEVLTQEEADKLVDAEATVHEAIRRLEQSGIIFIDEIDKIASRDGAHGPDVSRQGVQRDLLPLVEGSTVNTRYGMVRTDHVLFIASGAFHISKPSDLIPEFQGRFPIRVELSPLTREDFIRILTEPKNALLAQYTALLATENVTLEFQSTAAEEIARIAATVNERTENIGARRLHTVVERLLEELSFDGPELAGQRIVIDAAYVKDKLDAIVKDEDLSRFIL